MTAPVTSADSVMAASAPANPPTGFVPTAEPAAAPPYMPRPTGEDFFANPVQAVQRLLAAERAASLAREASQVQAIAEMNFKDDFRLWGDEIRAQMANTDPLTRANPEAWKLTVERTRGAHPGDYLADMQAKRGPSLAGATLQPRGAPGSVNAASVDLPDPESPELPEGLRNYYKSLHMTPQTMRTHLRQWYGDIPESEAWEKFKRSARKGDVLWDGRTLTSIPDQTEYTKGWQSVIPPRR